jgi:hypothetical protein
MRIERRQDPEQISSPQSLLIGRSLGHRVLFVPICRCRSAIR